jgi:hypothetical protein
VDSLLDVVSIGDEMSAEIIRLRKKLRIKSIMLHIAYIATMTFCGIAIGKGIAAFAR